MQGNLIFAHSPPRNLICKTISRHRVHAGQVDVNAEMVRQGAAWVYRQYNRDKSLLSLEAEARQAKRGLWALPEAERVAPWEWRKRGGTARAVVQGEHGQPKQAPMERIR